MGEILKGAVSDFVDSAIKEVIALEGIMGNSADVRRVTLNEVIEHFQALLDAVQHREFREDSKPRRAKECHEEIENKVRKKSYIESRIEEIVNECNINKSLEEYYKLGLSNAYGYIMYMIDQDFDKKDIKKVIMDSLKDDAQLRCDVFGVWGELYGKF